MVRGSGRMWSQRWQAALPRVGLSSRARCAQSPRNPGPRQLAALLARCRGQVRGVTARKLAPRATCTRIAWLAPPATRASLRQRRRGVRRSVGGSEPNRRALHMAMLSDCTLTRPPGTWRLDVRFDDERMAQHPHPRCRPAPQDPGYARHGRAPDRAISTLELL